MQPERVPERASDERVSGLGLDGNSEGATDGQRASGGDWRMSGTGRRAGGSTRGVLTFSWFGMPCNGPWGFQKMYMGPLGY